MHASIMPAKIRGDSKLLQYPTDWIKERRPKKRMMSSGEALERDWMRRLVMPLGLVVAAKPIIRFNLRLRGLERERAAKPSVEPWEKPMYVKDLNPVVAKTYYRNH